MSYDIGSEERPISILEIFAYIIIVFASLIAVTLILYAVAPLDYNGYIKRHINLIVMLYSALIAFIGFLIIFKYIPEIITEG